MSSSQIREFMTTNVTSISVNTPLAEMADIIKTEHLTSVVVVEYGLPIGIISESDMTALCAYLLAGGKPPELRQLMSASLVTVRAEKTCEQAAALMRRHKIRHIIVTDSTGLLCGIVTQSDLLRSRLHALEQQYNSTVRRVGKLHQSLEDSQAALERTAKQDALLGIGNRFAMDIALVQTAESGQPYSVAVIDIDYFKRYNDYYNHSSGDTVLIDVCQATRIALNGKAKLYRQSGNTLLALFTDDEQVDKPAYMLQILQSIEKLAISHSTAPLGRISVSIGLASCFTAASEPNHIVFRALNARDEAKHLGGDQYSIDTDHQLKAA